MMEDTERLVSWLHPLDRVLPSMSSYLFFSHLTDLCYTRSVYLSLFVSVDGWCVNCVELNDTRERQTNMKWSIYGFVKDE